MYEDNDVVRVKTSINKHIGIQWYWRTFVSWKEEWNNKYCVTNRVVCTSMYNLLT